MIDDFIRNIHVLSILPDFIEGTSRPSLLRIFFYSIGTLQFHSYFRKASLFSEIQKTR